MINGSPHGFFPCSRGLYQGDPPSLYLFVVIMEAFSQLVVLAIDGGFYQLVGLGVVVGRELRSPTCCSLMIPCFL